MTPQQPGPAEGMRLAVALAICKAAGVSWEGDDTALAGLFGVLDMADAAIAARPAPSSATESTMFNFLEYLDDYEFRFDEGGGHVPTDSERAMLEDFGNGLLTEIEAHRPTEGVPTEARENVLRNALCSGCREGLTFFNAPHTPNIRWHSNKGQKPNTPCLADEVLAAANIPLVAGEGKSECEHDWRGSADWPAGFICKTCGATRGCHD